MVARKKKQQTPSKQKNDSSKKKETEKPSKKEADDTETNEIDEPMIVEKTQKAVETETPVPEDQEGESDEESVYDSADEYYESDHDSNAEDDDGEDEEGDDSDDSDGEFEDQGSDSDDDLLEVQKKMDKLTADDDEDSVEILSDTEEKDFESTPRNWPALNGNNPGVKTADPSLWMHTDNLSSDDDDEAGTGNRIGRVPLHWYDEYEHTGYDAHGSKVMKPTDGGDLLDKTLAAEDGSKMTVHDALNAKDVEITPRQLELLRRIRAGAYAHPEHDGNPDYIDYFSGVDLEISGLGDNKHPPKSRFQPSKWEKLQVRRLLHKLKTNQITMDYLTGEVKDMNEYVDSQKTAKERKEGPFMLWKDDDEDELALRKGPQHIAAPKVPPPGHAESYNPSEEYLPTEEDLKEWEELDVKDRPHGLLIPKKFNNLRSVGAYEFSVRERFERCLDLYLCPRIMKRRLNIDPESLVPQLPKASDLRPFPTSQCIQYVTPHDEGTPPPSVRCISVSPDGQYLASGASDGFVRIWEVQSGRLLKSFNLHKIIAKSKSSTDPAQTDDSASKPIVSVEWNPNPTHHVILAAISTTAVLLATGTAGPNDTEITQALLSSALRTKGPIKNARAAKAVTWTRLKPDSPPITAFSGNLSGPVAILRTNSEISSAQWHRKGDYFLTLSPKAGAAAVLIHQLSKANSQQPFSKSSKGGDIQFARFHPTKPYMFVAGTQHVRVYHLVKQQMVKKLMSGCRWISSMDIHPSGDHVLVGSLDRRLVWFDLDLAGTPYKTLKYHERALREVGYHSRYPLMASCADDGTVHIFHSMVYSDLMRNPLIVPVKVLRGGHTVTNKLGVLAMRFHPTQPWLFSAGADGKIHLWQDI